MTAHDFSFEWQTQDQVMLKGRCWLPEQPKALVCLVHGFAEHIGRYVHVAAYLNAQGYGLMGFDLRGHGQSGGRRGHTPTYEDLLENIREMMALAAEKFEGLPLFLYGHSMGGNLAANYLIRHQPNYLKGAVITSPWLRLTQEPPLPLKILAKVAYLIFPQLMNPANLKLEHLSKDTTVQQAYGADPMILRKISAGMFTVVSKAGLLAIRQADKITLPVLLMHGLDDKITSADATREFAQRMQPELLTAHYWENMRHELHNETEKEQVLALIVKWLDDKMSVSETSV
ncbi:alpha/beta hydrolase [Rhodoflexus caldus]|uniref:alpha/beta hydrolase n=1 Tax=Rhodoflexus caldus TaxID=2891236 RepID=UPI002029BAE8|nr:alpha/beta hydrolase [Rhodoflexus caldus]